MFSMHLRCGLALVLIAALVGFNIISEELLSVDQVQDRSIPQGFNTLRQPPVAQHFKGEFALTANDTDVATGLVRVSIWSQPTGINSVRVNSLMLTLFGSGMSVGGVTKAASNAGSSGNVGGDKDRIGDHNDRMDGLRQVLSSDVDMSLRGVEVSSAGRMTAFGVWDPSVRNAFGPSPCRLDAMMDLDPGEGVATTSNSPSVRSVEPHVLEEQSIASLRGGAHDHRGPALSGKDGSIEALVAKVVSLDCRFSLAVKAIRIDVQRIGRKVMRYAMWVNLLTAVQIRCYLLQIRHTEDGPAASRLSMLGIAIQALTDGYDSFLHLSLSVSTQYMFTSFAFVSLFKFVLFAFLEVRYLLTIWRLRNRDIFEEGWDAVRRQLSKVYSYFYGALVCGLSIIYYYPGYLDLLMLLLQGYWLPQIVLDVRMGSKSPLHPIFLFGISISRCLGLLYLWGCPSGIFDGDVFPQLPGSPSATLCVAAVALQFAQVSILTSQRLFGPRWFIPWLCLPHVYNYSRNSEIPSNTDCVICMGELSPEDMQHVAIAPCDHRFHRECLEKWMEVKMECPTCRAELPPLS